MNINVYLNQIDKKMIKKIIVFIPNLLWIAMRYSIEYIHKLIMSADVYVDEWIEDFTGEERWPK
jgi:hypothetical protein